MASLQYEEAVHVHLEGYTAFFKHPLTITGTQVTLPQPPYSTLLGLVGACAGRIVTHKDTRMGFEFRSTSVGPEIERTERLVMEKSGKLRPHRDGQGILKRYVHFKTCLDLYLTNTELLDAFRNPVSTPCLGRSQDIHWITKASKVTLERRSSGNIGPTMLPAMREKIPSMIIRCPEWFQNDTPGYTRKVGPVGYYQAISASLSSRIPARMEELYHPSDCENHDDVVYIHKWLC
jgi:CRISPR-associated protein Cas5t